MSNLQELLKQQEAITAQIREVRQAEVTEAVNKVRELVNQYELSIQDVFPAGRRSSGRSRAGIKVAPKYRDSATGQTWTGRGKAPKWIEGKDREQYLIA